VCSSDLSYDLIKPHVSKSATFTDEDIIARMMLPMATELARCLDEGIIESAAEADMALVYGVGFPPFRGGLFSWIDSIGAEAICAMSEKHKGLGKIYEATESMRDMAKSNGKYFS